MIFQPKTNIKFSFLTSISCSEKPIFSVSEQDKKWSEFQEYLAQKIAVVFDISPYLLGAYKGAVPHTSSSSKLPDTSVEKVQKIHDIFAQKKDSKNMIFSAETLDTNDDEMYYWEQSFGTKWGEENAE